jgi:hypothetical protein
MTGVYFWKETKSQNKFSTKTGIKPPVSLKGGVRLETKTFYGVTELANALNWPRAKVHTYWKQREKIEDPAAYVGDRPLWTFEQVERIKKHFKN